MACAGDAPCLALPHARTVGNLHLAGGEHGEGAGDADSAVVSPGHAASDHAGHRRSGSSICCQRDGDPTNDALCQVAFAGHAMDRAYRARCPGASGGRPVLAWQDATTMRRSGHVCKSPSTATQAATDRQPLPAFILGVSIAELLIFLLTFVVQSDAIVIAETIVHGVEPAEEDGMKVVAMTARTLYLCGGQSLRQRQFWRLVTAMFLHADLTHVLLNVSVQLLFGTPVERSTGSIWTSVLYITSGVGGSLLSAVLSTPGYVTVGSSGAIHGIIATYICGRCDVELALMPWLKERVPPCLRPLVGPRGAALIVAVSLVGGVMTPGVDSWAHFGGGLAGMALTVVRSWRSGWQHACARWLALAFLVGYLAAGAYLTGCKECLEPPGQLHEIWT